MVALAGFELAGPDGLREAEEMAEWIGSGGVIRLAAAMEVGDGDGDGEGAVREEVLFLLARVREQWDSLLRDSLLGFASGRMVCLIQGGGTAGGGRRGQEGWLQRISRLGTC
jgi:hypothetical protein